MVTSEIARDIAQEAYIWAYPLVLMDVTRKVMTNHEVPKGVGAGPVNQVGHARMFPPASFRQVVRPNFDTLYSIAWFDLEEEPLVMTLPQTEDANYPLSATDGEGQPLTGAHRYVLSFPREEHRPWMRSGR